MKIIPVKGYQDVYTSNVYMILGEWKRLEDVTTLIDVGSDPSIINAINKLETGIGKKRVEQVILTHCHSDHTAALPAVRKAFNPEIFASSAFADGVDHILKNGDRLRVGECMGEIIHTPGHSSDSISLYIEEVGILFVGDAPVIVRTIDNGYEDDYVEALKELSRRKIRKIYFGHGEPLLQDTQAAILESLMNARKSRTSRNRLAVNRSSQESSG